MVQTPNGGVNLLSASCPLDQAEPYGNCLTYGPGHYETWAHWRRDKTVEPALRALVRSYEYEDWPRGRIVFDQSRGQMLIVARREHRSRRNRPANFPPRRVDGCKGAAKRAAASEFDWTSAAKDALLCGPAG